MNTIILALALIILLCVLFNRISGKLGIPVLLAFIILGMLFGSDGIMKVAFDNYQISEYVCSFALIFIMFYGGFGTKWSEAKPVAVKAILLSSLGTIVTAALTGGFCYLVLHIDLLESFLIGAVISSTDAASVFSVLRSKHLNLKYGTASLLEVESGSNDPFSYMLTIIMITLLNQEGGGNFVWMVFAQIFFGLLCGFVIAKATVKFMRHFKFSAGFDAIFIVAVAMLAYALPAAIGGNGYLSVYITGILLGNQRIGNKAALVNFFDGITALMQMLLFFLLGLLATPSQLPLVAGTAALVALFLTFVARPVAVFAIMSPFRCPLNQKILVSWSGMRGAASIVFAIMVIMKTNALGNDIFHMVFFIVLFSILVQGSLLPMIANKLQMTDNSEDVMKTFTDYSDEVPVQFIKFTVTDGHPWNKKCIREIVFPPDSILVLLLRGDNRIIPNGDTEIQSDDVLILSGKSSGKIDGLNLYEKEVAGKDEIVNKLVKEISNKDHLIIMIKRGGDVIIPKGDTEIKKNDVLVINDVIE